MEQINKKNRNNKHIRRLRTRKINARINHNDISASSLEFRVSLEKVRNCKDTKYYACVRFPGYYASRIELDSSDYKKNYEEIFEKIKNRDYEIRLNSRGRLKIKVSPYL